MILTSRADNVRTRLASCAVAALYAMPGVSLRPRSVNWRNFDRRILGGGRLKINASQACESGLARIVTRSSSNAPLIPPTVF